MRFVEDKINLMYLYQFQDRGLKLTPENSSLTFPNDVSVKVTLGPANTFGVGKQPNRLVVRGSDATFLFNANTGRVYVKCTPTLRPLKVQIEADNVCLRLKGQTLNLTFHCQDYDMFYSTLRTYLHVFPTLFNIVLANPPIVELIEGKVGDVKFRWEHIEAIAFFPEMSQVEIEKEVADSFTRIGLLDARLAAALHYFHVASRLAALGHSPGEFMAESILNMCKALQVLFGEKYDDVRLGLHDLGYTVEEVEGAFIPLMILRNHFDVGHAQIATPTLEQTKILYAYLSEAEMTFQEMFSRLFRKRAKERVVQTPLLQSNLTREEQNKFDRLISVMEARLKRYEHAQPSVAKNEARQDNVLRVHFKQQ